MNSWSKSWLGIQLEALGALMVVLFFAGFGSLGQTYIGDKTTVSISHAFHVIANLIQDFVYGQHLHAQFWGVSVSQVLVSVRLIGMAVVFAIVVGTFLVVLRSTLQRGLLARVLEVVFGALESIPEAMYVVLFVLMVLFCLRFGISLPILSDSRPTWNETWIPALALAMPGGLYLQRILYLRLRDERDAQYTVTARAKGVSRTRIVLSHVLPNLWPAVIRQLPFVTALVLSSAMFTEFFLEYSGVLYSFTNFAVGYNVATGIPPGSWQDAGYVDTPTQAQLQNGGLGVHKPTGIPPYQVGLVFLIGALLVLLWMLARLVSHLIHRWKYGAMADSIELATPTVGRYRMEKWPVVAGGLLLLLILVLGADPALLTQFTGKLNPNAYWNYQQYGANMSTPPSAQHLLGTDVMGRDLLALTLHGTYRTLAPVALITGLVYLGSMAIAVIGFTFPKAWPQRVIRFVGGTLSGVPVLMVVFLALYQDDLFVNNKWLHYVLWISLFEIGIGSYSFLQVMQEWSQYRFVEGAVSIGRSRWGMLRTHFKSWLGFYSLEFIFSEIARVLSLMMQLAAFHIFIVSIFGMLPNGSGEQGVIPAFSSWVNSLGEATGSMNYLYSPYLLYAPVLALTITMVGANMIARGLRGKAQK